MKTYTAEQMAEIIEKHAAWMDGVDIGERANLSGADLRGADLRGANLRGANLRYADLRDASLSCANLRGANLRDANLRYADLRDADLRGADLRGADLRGANLREIRELEGALGNGIEIKSIQCGTYSITYTATHMQIGCQIHEISEWWGFGSAQIHCMDNNATAWWLVWKPILKAIISASPAK